MQHLLLHQFQGISLPISLLYSLFSVDPYLFFGFFRSPKFATKDLNTFLTYSYRRDEHEQKQQMDITHKIPYYALNFLFFLLKGLYR